MEIALVIIINVKSIEHKSKSINLFFTIIMEYNIKYLKTINS